jgi:hypothetical protein
MSQRSHGRAKGTQRGTATQSRRGTGLARASHVGHEDAPADERGHHRDQGNPRLPANPCRYLGLLCRNYTPSGNPTFGLGARKAPLICLLGLAIIGIGVDVYLEVKHEWARMERVVNMERLAAENNKMLLDLEKMVKANGEAIAATTKPK